MEANEYAFVHGMARTRESLDGWRRDPRRILGSWFLGAAGIAMLLLLAVWVVAFVIEPDLGFVYLPGPAHGLDLDEIAEIVARNSLVLALHAFACVAGFIAGSSLPLSTARKTGLSRWVHERARPIAFTWVVAVTCFSLLTQALALGVIASTIADSVGISPGVLLLTALPHALLELTAVFLPLAAWTIASRRSEWDQLLAATLVTVTIAIPMLIASSIWEVHVWPYILEAVSPAA
ncbi:MAG: hypothetical protein ACRDL6_01990 [Solirubrobacterales bacterium]